MAGTPGGLLQSASAGAKAALPDLQESSKELRAEQREAIRQLALDEGASNAEARREADLYMQGKGRYAELAQADKKDREDRAFQRERLNIESGLARDQIAATRAAAAGRDKPDFMQSAVAARYSVMKQVNDRRPTLKKGEKFIENYHRVTDETLMNRAFKEVMGSRYFDPATNPLTQNRAAAINQVLNPDGGGDGAGQSNSNRIRFDALK